MCSKFLDRMENYQGDLDDIIRAGAGSTASNTTTAVPALPAGDWGFPSNLFNNFSSSGMEELSDDFGHPFSSLRDPFLQDMDPNVSGFFRNSNNSIEGGNGTSTGGGSGGGGGGDGVLGNKNLDEEMKMRPPNIFSRMLQISPSEKLLVFPGNSPAMAASSPRGLKVTGGGSLVSNDMISPNSSKNCLLESPGVQISSPRNAGIKRRKSQPKKVVCIPAPAPMNNRPGGGGEVVPSDLWAWRKYGQKPIKGSPYPRGYYRCSSSKGCSARKQVERSRTDPNMLVITYTSEHNHPWPTQRNALAGSTRSQTSSKNQNPASKASPNSQSQKVRKAKEETENNNISESAVASPMADVKSEDLDNRFEMKDAEINEGFPHSYNKASPLIMGSNQSEDLFAELGEIESTDPLHLLFMDGFSGDDGSENKSLDPFSFYDWPRNNNHNTHEEAAKRNS